MYFHMRIVKSHLRVSGWHREQMQEVFVGLERWRAAVDGQQVVDVAVQVLQFAQVDLVLVQVVWQGLVERDQVLEMDPQDGHLEAVTLVVNTPVVAVVASRGEQVRHLAQGLKGRGTEPGDTLKNQTGGGKSQRLTTGFKKKEKRKRQYYMTFNYLGKMRM